MGGSAVLFAELIGVAELYARAGDRAAHAAVASCTRNLGDAAVACGARVVKTLSSRLMVLAADVDTAAVTAASMHSAAGAFRAVSATPLSLGVGFHRGPIIQDGGDVFGDAVNLAARLVEQAASGQILLAAETGAALSAPYRRMMRSLYSIPLKGRSEEIALCELMWNTEDGARTFLPFAPPARNRARLTLKYRGVNLVLENGAEALSIGREDGCGLTLADAQASRHHCTIQQRNGHFVLLDRSTNGTYITVEGEPEIRVRRDQLVLRRRGWLAFGRPCVGGAEAAEYSCD